MRLGVCSSFLLLLAIPSFATTYVVPTDAELVRKSEAIVIAVADRSETVEGDLGLETITQFIVVEGIKGVDSGDVIAVAEPGGVKGRKALLVEGAPQFVLGDRALLFLSRDKDRWTVTDYALGHFRFKSKKDGTEVLVRAEGHIVGWDIEGKVHEEKLREESRFLQFLRSVVAGRSVESDNYLVSGDPSTLIERRNSRVIPNVAPYANSTYTSYLTAPQSPEPGCPTPADCPWPSKIGNRWREVVAGGDPAGTQAMPGGVTFFKTTAQNLSGVGDGGQAAIQAGLAAWTNDASSAINLIYGGQRVDGSVDDVVNVVEFNDPQNRITGSWTGSGTIAITFCSFNAIELVNAEYWWMFQGADVVFQNLYTAGEASLNAAMTHEIGHGIGWRHSDRNRINNASACDTVTEECSGSAIMTATVISAFGNTLQTWDRNAAAAVYPAPAVVCVAPTNVIATATSATSVSVSWNAVVGATQYEVHRGTTLGSVALLATTANTTYTDAAASAGVTYIYRVKAVCGATTSASSSLDIATTIIFTDDPLAAGVTVVKAVHLSQLRQAVNAVRTAAGLSGAVVTDSASAGVLIKAVHITELRTALDAARSPLGLSTGGYTDSITAGTLVNAVHFQELRNRTK